MSVFAPRHAHAAGRAALARAASILGAQLRMAAGGAPDLIYTRWHVASLPAALWARAMRVPLVVEVNGPLHDLFAAWPRVRWLSGLVKAAMRRQLRWAEAVVAVTPGLAEHVRAEAGRPSRVVANGADTALFRPEVAPWPGLPPAYVVFFGELAPWHDLATLMAAVGEPAWPAGVRLVIVGGGAQQAAVEAAAARTPQIQFLGRLPHAAVPRAVAPALAAFVLIRQADGRAATGTSPLKLYEAMACGVPVIVSDLPGQADVVREAGCGVVVPPGQPAAVAAAVAALAADPAARRRMGANARAYALARCSWERRAGEIADILAPLLARGRAG